MGKAGYFQFYSFCLKNLGIQTTPNETFINQLPETIAHL